MDNFSFWFGLRSLFGGISTRMYTAVLILTLVGWNQHIFAQENNKKIDYTHSHLNPGDALMLVGYFDDQHYIQLYLQRDADLWEGHVYFPEDSLSFKLEGGWTEDTEMLLLEFNDDGEKSGFWQIVKEDDHYKAIWSNQAQTMQKETFLYDDLWTPDVKKDFYRQLISYEVKIEKTELLLTTLANRNGLNRINVRNLKNRTAIDSDMVCLNASCSDIQLNFKQLNTYGKSSLNATIDKNGLSGFFTTEKAKVLAIAPLKTSTRETRLKTELTSKYSIALEYPVLSGLTMSLVVQNTLDSVMNTLKKELDVKGPQPELAVAQRQELFAFAWFEIFYWDDLLISGKWTIQKSWSPMVTSLPFNYDLETGIPVNFPDQFKKDFDYRFFIEKYKKSASQKLLETKDLMLKNKLSQCTFPHLNFDERGLVYTTDFDTIFGQQEIWIPASELTGQLKSKSKFKKVFVK